MGICSYSVLMPEEYRKKGLQPLMLSDAARNGSLLRIRCVGCSPARWYEPIDMIKLFGNIPALNLEREMKCETCGGHPYVEVRSATAQERQQIKIRRLDRVWWVRRVRWRDN